ncbi:MAG: N-acetylmuramoyl-L-alanine amidase [Bacteroidetes bacterium]|nr:MAG: N-acetylmuramoyl-L-alanine amidase [Bacteroidota bacterium]
MKKTFFNFILICSLVLISASSLWSKSDFSGSAEEKRISVVVIDPGHGGKDFGASVGNAKEKDIVLDLALRLGNSIKAEYPEIKVIYTRTKDVFIPLYERANIANKNKADLFISIHVNGTDKTSVQGTETFVLGQHRSKDNLEVAKKENSVILLEDDYNTKYEGFDPNSPESYIMFELVQDEYLEQSVMFASAIQNQFRLNAKRIDRSVKQAGFLVLRQTTMPSVLIEVGFISHANERSYLVSEKGKAALSSSIFNAFSDYKKKIENKSSFAVHTENEGLKSSSITANSELMGSGKTNIKNVEAKTVESVKNSNLFFSVQIAASAKKMETNPSNFKGEKNIFRVDAKDISRYFSGKFQNLKDAENEKKRIQGKFPESFVVAFENNELISVKKALEKM